VISEAWEGATLAWPIDPLAPGATVGRVIEHDTLAALARR
jgi:hypothetical protein